MRVISILAACVSANNNFAFHLCMFVVCWLILPREYTDLTVNAQKCFEEYAESIKILKWMHLILFCTAFMNFYVDLRTSPVIVTVPRDRLL